MGKRLKWGLIAAGVLACAVGLVLWNQKINESASPEVRRLAAVRPFRVPEPTPAPDPPAPTEPAVPALSVPEKPKPAPVPPGVTAIQSVRDHPDAFLGQEVTILGTVKSASYGKGMKDCAFTYQIEDAASRVWVLPYSKTTPELGRAARVKGTIVKEPDRPWSPAQADAFYLKETSWSYEK